MTVSTTTTPRKRSDAAVDAANANNRAWTAKAAEGEIEGLKKAGVTVSELGRRRAQ